MSRSGRRRTAAVLIAALIGFAALHCVIRFAAADLTVGCADLIQLRLDNAPVSGRDVERMTREKNEAAELAKTAGGAMNAGNAAGAETGAKPGASPLYTAWTEVGGEKLENEELSRRASSDVIYYCGDNNLRFDLALDMGCAVPADLAFQLWGSQREEVVAGRSLLIGGREFTVEKVLPQGGWMEKWSGGAVIARVDGAGAEAVEPGQSTGGTDDGSGEEIRFDVLDVSVPDEYGLEGAEDSSAFSIDEVIMAGGLRPSSVIRGSQLFAALNALRGLPVWGAALWAAIPLAGRARGRYKEIKSWEPECDIPMSFVERFREDALQTMKRVFPPAALGIALILLTAATVGTPFLVPDSFIPTRWSDFSFWTSALKETGQAAGAFLTMELYGPDVWFRSLALRMIAGCFGQTALAVWAMTAARGGGVPAALDRELWAPGRRVLRYAADALGGQMRRSAAVLSRRRKVKTKG